MPVTGSDQMRAVARDLKAVGSPAVGLRRQYRRNLTAAVAPMVTEVKRNAFNIPAKGDSGSTGLRVALMRATRSRIVTVGKNITVGLIVDGARMPASQQSLPQLMEGERRWRHKLFGDSEHWYPQASHPFVAPAIPSMLLRATAAVNAAVESAAKQLSRGSK